MNENRIREKLQTVFPFAEKQLRHLVETHPDHFPLYTENGKWSMEGDRWTNWCEGFLGGQLWLLYEHNQNPWFRKKAEHYSRLIENRKTDRSVHDLGFLFFSTYKRWFALTGEKELQNIVIEAGQTLAKRFQEKGQYLCSFMGKESLFIDIMMNVGIIFHAAQQTGDENLWRIARAHCDTTRKYLVRGNGSTSHEGIFNTETGEFLHQSTQQGWRNDSSWVRGQAWALYGFGTVFTYTQDSKDLETAELVAQHYIENAPEHGIPPNDFDEPAPDLPWESSAAAIAAGGFWQLSKLVQDPVKQRFYRQYALKILDTLTEPDFMAYETPGWEGLLKHAIYHNDKNLGKDESVMWGDYFFLETVSKVVHE